MYHTGIGDIRRYIKVLLKIRGRLIEISSYSHQYQRGSMGFDVLLLQSVTKFTLEVLVDFGAARRVILRTLMGNLDAAQ